MSCCSSLDSDDFVASAWRLHGEPSLSSSNELLEQSPSIGPFVTADFLDKLEQVLLNSKSERLTQAQLVEDLFSTIIHADGATPETISFGHFLHIFVQNIGPHGLHGLAGP